MIDHQTLVTAANLAIAFIAGGAIGYCLGFAKGEETVAPVIVDGQKLMPPVAFVPAPHGAPQISPPGTVRLDDDQSWIWENAFTLRQLANEQRATALALGEAGKNWQSAKLYGPPEQEILSCHRRALALDYRAAQLEGGAK